MNNQLYFNALNFELPAKARKFYFSKDHFPYSFKIHKSIFPNDLLTYLPEPEDFCYTSFGKETEDCISFDIDFKTENQDFIKKYYNELIRFHFKKTHGLIVKPNFIGDNQIWVSSPALTTAVYQAFEKFSLKIQFNRLTDKPELVISYDGVSKMLLKPVSEIIPNISPTNFTKVIFKNQIRNWRKINEIEDIDYSKCYPLVNLKLKTQLNFPMETRKRENRYKKYQDRLNFFFKVYINKDEFKKIIPHRGAFIQVSESKIDFISSESNNLIFKNGKSIVPNEGIKTLKAYKPSPYPNIHLFFIFHKNDYKSVSKINEALMNRFEWFNGIMNYIELPLHTTEKFSIMFTDKENPLPEIERKLQERDFESEVKYIAVYLTPYDKYEIDKEKRKIYYRVKEILLKRGITSQVIDPRKMEAQGANWVYSLPNIAVAMLAKMDGIPWKLDVPVKKELIIGVGAFKNLEQNLQYIGSAFSFTNTGQFNGFEYFMKNEIREFAGKVAYEVRKYSSTITNPERLIIHFYKTMSEREIDYIEKAILNLGLSIPIFIVSINKTESEDIIAFDKGWKDLMPKSGTYINIGRNKYLLFNNSRYSDDPIKATEGYHFPVKLKIDCTNKDLLENQNTISELLDQVYQFSRMYWKSIRQQNLPVTIKYPEIIAQMAPYFAGEDIPEYGKKSLWFL
jgi:hypothetical protein